MRPMAVTGARALIARDAEIERLRDVLDAAATGSGAVVVLEGEVGAGKTALLEWTRATASAGGMHVRSAVAADLEQGLTYGIVRRLFGRDVARSELPETMVALLGGIATGNPPDGTTVCFGVEHLVAELAGAGPLLVAIDDAHWADRASLEALAFLARRITELGAVLIIASRVDEASRVTDVLDAIAAAPGALRLRPQSFDAASAQEVIREQFGTEPAPAFVDACLRATGGNPLYLVELCRELVDTGVKPSTAAVGRVDEARPDAIRRAVLLRLGRASDTARRVASAVAVLGDGAELRHVAALAGLDEAIAANAVDELERVAVLSPALPARFAHPLLRAVVYDDHPAAARAAAHGRAADVLRADGADPERVAAHLLRAPVSRDASRRVALEDAASAARQRGGAAAAVAYLERAIQEGGEGADVAALLARLGAAQLLAGDGRAQTTLETAIATAGDEATRVRATSTLAHAQALAGRHHDALALLEELAATSPEQAETLYDLATALLGYGFAAGPEALARVVPIAEAIAATATAESASGRRLLGIRGAVHAFSGAPLELWLPDVERYLVEGAQRSMQTRETFRVMAITQLARYERFDLADAVLGRWLSLASAEGSPFELMHATAAAANLAYTRGDMLAAEAFALESHAIALEAGWLSSLGSSAVVLALLEQDRLDEAAAVVEEIDPMLRETPATRSLGNLAGARGRYRLFAGDVAGAVADLVPVYEEGGSALWRSYAIEALQAADRSAEARDLAERGVARASKDPPMLQALAQRDLAMVTPGDEGIGLFTEARASLRPSQMRFERARTALLLGMALRRVRRPTEARQPLAEALELANQCGAWRVEAQARGELLAAGARPRRVARTGLASLTAAERRVATLAASGNSNPEIARALFISRKSVETHLSHVYQKLAIAGRSELATALG